MAVTSRFADLWIVRIRFLKREALHYNIFTPQLATSLMARQIGNGMSYTMFTRQCRMTARIEELASQVWIS